MKDNKTLVADRIGQRQIYFSTLQMEIPEEDFLIGKSPIDLGETWEEEE